MPPEPLDAAIIFATLGDLVPAALKAVRKGGRVVCAGIHMSDIPAFPYSALWEERQIVSVANLTRQDGVDFLQLVPEIDIVTTTTRYPLDRANDALADLRAGPVRGGCRADSVTRPIRNWERRYRTSFPVTSSGMVERGYRSIRLEHRAMLQSKCSTIASPRLGFGSGLASIHSSSRAS